MLVRRLGNAADCGKFSAVGSKGALNKPPAAHIVDGRTETIGGCGSVIFGDKQPVSVAVVGIDYHVRFVPELTNFV